MSKCISIYSIAKGYWKATIWAGDSKTKECISIQVLKAPKGSQRKDRYDHVKRFLEAMEITCPKYQERDK